MNIVKPTRSALQGAGALGERGAAAVEFAIVVSLLVLITGGIIEFGRVFWYLDALTKATRDGARLMSNADVKTISTAGASAQALVVAAANAAGLSSPPLVAGDVFARCLDGDYNIIPCQDNVAPANVRVKISYSVSFGSWFAIPLPSGPVSLTPHTTMRYMR